MAITSIKTGSSFTNLQKYNDFLGPNSAYIPSNFESIATATGTGSSGTVTFSSIPSTYASLQIRWIAKDNVGSEFINVRLNGDTGSNYARHALRGNGATVGAAGGASQTSFYGFGVSNGTNSTYNNVGILDIHDYASTTKNKTVRTISGVDGNGTGEIDLLSGLWMSTSAVTSVSFIMTGGANFDTTTVFSLYGIK